MTGWKKLRCLIRSFGAPAMTAAALCTGLAVSDAAILRIDYDTSARPILPGDQFDIFVTMSSLGTDECAGFQAFLEFDAGQMFFIGGTYTTVPFGLAILPIFATGDEINLASGINTFAGQPPTTSDAVLAHLVFQATAEFCTPTVEFRTNAPPTRLTDPVGTPITPLNLRSLGEPECLGDIVPDGGDGSIDVFDLLEVLDRWLEPPPSIADVAPAGCDGSVDVFDLLFILQNWGTCS